MPLRTLHRSSAFLLLVFLTVHVTNHLVSLWGIQRHVEFMETARAIYRAPFIEPVLLFCAAFQALSGLWLVARGWRGRRGAVAWLQALSGLYLAFFLLVHVGAILFGRLVLHLDTNFYFAAAGLHVPPNQYFFIPYYFLSLVALSAHLGCALYWFTQSASQRLRHTLLVGSLLLGGVVSTLIVLSLAGKLHPVEIPAKYKATYASAA